MVMVDALLLLLLLVCLFLAWHANAFSKMNEDDKQQDFAGSRNITHS